MRLRSAKKNKKLTAGFDWMLLLIVAILTVLGVLMQYSASEYSIAIVSRSAIFIAVGATAMIVCSFIPIRFYKKLGLLLFAATAAATASTFVIGESSKGAKRWIRITSSITIQPSEFLKIGVIIGISVLICKYINEINNLPELKVKQIVSNFREHKYSGIADWWSCCRERITELKSYIFILVSIAASGGIVAVLTKDLGTAVIIVGIGFVMLFVISPRIKYLLAIGGLGVLGGLALIFSMDYRADRVAAWLNLQENESDLGYQIKQGLYAIGSGGLLGKGLGKSIQKSFIPEAHTDMIFSVLCEELGLLGGLVLIVLYILLVWRLKNIYDQIQDLFGKMVIVGVASHILLQAAVNIAVITNIIPNTGIPLPFISYGGTSIVCLLMEIGIVMAMKRGGGTAAETDLHR